MAEKVTEDLNTLNIAVQSSTSNGLIQVNPTGSSSNFSLVSTESNSTIDDDSSSTTTDGESKFTNDIQSDIDDEGDGKSRDHKISSPENCVYFVTSKPEGRLLFLNKNSKTIREFPRIELAPNGNREEDVCSPSSPVPASIVSCSAHKHSIWALTDDGFVYLYHFPAASRIRHQVHTYENQRYRPFMGGWTSKLLPIDRYPWSSKGGQRSLPKDSFHLFNSDCWQWEAPWKLAEVVDGQATEQDGWQYAGNFTSCNFGAKSVLTVCRRRKWIRNMIYSRYHHWVRVDLASTSPNIYPKSGTDIFLRSRKREVVCLAVGGSRLNGAVKGHLSVWALTSDNRVLFRDGVSAHRPEGSHWRLVDSVVESINQIAVGPTSATWIVTWNGSLLVRRDVNARTPWGSKWVNLVAPQDRDVPRFQRVSIGEKSAWAISANAQKVYYLPNIDAKFIDYKWIEVVGEMFGVYVGLNNHVWAVPLTERSGIFYRDKVIPDEICGRSWTKLEVDLKDVIFCGSEGGTSSTLTNVSELTVCKIREISSTSFEWNPAIAFSCFSKSAKFKILPKSRLEVLSNFKSRNSKEFAPFYLTSEFLEHKLVDNDEVSDNIDYRERLTIEVYTNIQTSKNSLKVTNKLLKCQLSVKSQLDSNIEFLNFEFEESNICAVYLELSRIVCVRQKHDLDSATLLVNFLPFTNNSGFFSVVFPTYKEMFTWCEDFQLFTLSIVNRANISQQPRFDDQLFFVDDLGNAFVHTNLRTSENCNMTWEPLKGHWKNVLLFGKLLLGLTHDKSLWLNVFTEENNLSETMDLDVMHDYEFVTVQEIETWNVAIGYRGKYFKCSPKIFWNETMASNKYESTSDLSCVQLPSTRWEWVSNDWVVDYTNADRDGWSYGPDIENPRSFHPVASRGDHYRKRTHKRLCIFKQKSNWRLLSTKPAIVELATTAQRPKRGILVDDLSSQKMSKCFSKDSLSSSDYSSTTTATHQRSHQLWALDEDGFLFKAMLDIDKIEGNLSGEECWEWNECLLWKQVELDNQLVSITAVDYSGGQLLIGLSNDGITLLFFYRDYFNPVDGPYIVEPKRRHKKLANICAGGDACTLVVLDCYKTLWIREGTSWDFPEGHGWTKLVHSVYDVSIDLDNTIWITLSDYNSQKGVLAYLYDGSTGFNYLESSPNMVQAPKLSLNRRYQCRIVIGPNIKHISCHSFSAKPSS